MRFPTINAQQGISADGGNPDVRVSPAIGQALQQLGATGMQVADYWAAKEKQKTRFQAEQDFLKITDQIAADDLDASQSMAADGSGWRDSRLLNAQQRLKQYLDSVPADLREEFASRADVFQGGYINRQTAAEISAREKWAMGGIETATNNLMNRVAANPGGRLDAEETLRGIIATAPISTAARETLMRDVPGLFAEPAAMSLIEAGDFEGARSVVGSALSYRDMTRAVESGGNDTAAAGTSSARGRYQITNPTYRMLANTPEGKAAGLPMIGKSDPVPTDPAVQEASMSILTARNAELLNRNDVPVTGKSLRLVHFLGPKALDFLRADPETPAATLDPKGAEANRNVFYKGKNRDIPRTVREVITNETRKFSGAPISDAELTTVGSPDYSKSTALFRSVESRIAQKEAEQRAIAGEQARVYMKGASDYLSYRANGGDPVPALEARFSPDAVAGLGVPEAEGWAAASADSMRTGDLLRAFRAADTPGERIAIRDQALSALGSPDNFEGNARTAGVITKAYDDFQKKLSDAPGEVAAMSGQVQSAIKAGSGAGVVAAMLAEQDRLGVPSYKQMALPEAFAADVAGRFAATPPEKLTQEVQAMAAEYGDAWPRVFAQIGAKLPAQLAIAATMEPGNAATRLVALSSMKSDELDAGLPSTARGEVSSALLDDDTMSRLRLSMVSQSGGAQTYAALESAARDLALDYMRSGKNQREAVQQAARDVSGGVGFAERGGLAVRVPKGIDSASVEEGMDRIATSFAVDGIDLPETRSGMAPEDVSAAFASSIQRNGVWVNDAYGKGLYLYVEDTPVTRNGEPLLFTWDELTNVPRIETIKRAYEAMQ